MLLRKFAAALACAAAAVASSAFALVPLPPTPSVRLAVNPVTNKVYAVNKDANTVTVLDATVGTTTSIPVGAGPDFVAVDPTRNRIFVDNARDASLTVIDGSTDTVIGTQNIGSMGPITINADPSSLHNVVYVMRMTSAATDEVTYFYPNNDAPTWYTVATDSYQPSAVAVNPATHTIFVTHYATGDLRVIDGTFTGIDFPHPPSITMCTACSTSTDALPFAAAANPVTNKVYVITQHQGDSIAVVNPATLGATFPAIASGHGVGPQALVVNPVSNKIYAAFSGEVIVIDGATNALTYVPIANAGSGGIALGIDYGTNRVYAAAALGTLSVIDGDTDTVISSAAIEAGTSSIGINPITHAVYLYGPSGIAAMAGAAGSVHTVPITTTITPFSGNTSSPSNTFSLSASSTFAPTAMPVRKVYYRIDSTTGPWTEAAASSGGYSGSFSSLSAGSHTIYAYAVDDQVAPLYTGPQSIPLVGQMASYTFTVAGTKTSATVSLASSANPANVGQPVTFTATVSGSSGTATGTITFRDGTTALCASVALSSGAATCATATLIAGTHSITAEYSGDTLYNGATSGALAQAISKWTATPSLASSANPSTIGSTVTFNATVSGGSGTPTGSITFLDGATSLCAAMPLNAGGASCSTSALAAGSHSIVARYSGDATYNGVDSSALAQSVSKATASVALASSANPSASGQSVTFTATVSGSAGTPDGSVAFLDGGTALAGCASLALANGSASCNAGALTTGVHAITAQYSGNGTYNAASSGTLTQNVEAPPPATADLAVSQSASPNPAVTGQDVTFTLTVSNNGSIDASGVVLTDTLPSSATFVSAPAGCSNTSGTISCNLGTVANGASVSVQVTLRPTAAGTLTNNASVSGAQTDPNTANNTASLALTVNDAPAPAPAPQNTLQGLSTRMQVLSGDNVLIGGFVIGGSTAKTVVVRARGPSLTQQGVAGALADPTLTLVPSSGAAITNDDWGSAPNAAQIQASGFAPPDAKESAILVTLQPGAYTAIVSGVGNTTGVALVEVYEVDHPEVPLTAISTRGDVQTGDNVMIGGFIIPGTTPRTVVVRGRGPSLASQGIAGALANPTLQLVRGTDNSTVAINDDWGSAPNAAQISASGYAPGDPRESAILVTLDPGAYTTIVSGVGGSSGIGMVEIFALQ